MSNLEKQLIFIYSIICVVLVCVLMVVLFSEKFRQIKFSGSDWWKWLLIVCIFTPLFCLGIFFFFVIVYGIVDVFIKDDFITKQIIVNIFNAWILYLIFVSLKKNQK